jgi:hypothetical protein
MNITILKTVLELLKLFFELLSKLVTGLAALARSRRRARQQRAQSIGRVTYRRERPWIARRFAKGANFAGIDRLPVATSTDDVLLRPVPEQQPIASYTTRPVLAKELIRR